MSEAKHTPGPWIVNLDRDGSPAEIVPSDGRTTVPCECPECLEDRSYPREGRTYSALVTCDSHVYGPSLADAHLIAAAPELLAELKHLARLLEPALNNGQANVPGLATLNKAWLVIAKAEGR